MKTKLIVVEGIPGSGKTTTAQLIRECVAKTGTKSLLYLENARYHPVDLDNLSYVDEKQFSHLHTQFNEYRSQIEEITEKAKEGYFIHYLRWFDIYNEKMPEDFLSGIFKYDAHDTLSPDKYQSLLVERWEQFYTRAKTRDEIVIFECNLFQNPLTIFIGKHNYEAPAVISHILEIAELVQDLNPLLIYLRGDSVRQTLDRVIPSRPQAWIDGVIEYVTGQGYGKKRNLIGLEGVFSFYEMLQSQMDELVSTLDWNKLIIDNSSWEWKRYNQTIESYIRCHI